MTPDTAITWLDAGQVEATDVGGKGAGLSFLAGCLEGGPSTVPRCFAVTTAAFDAAIDADVRARINAVVEGAPADAPLSDLEVVARQIRAIVADVPLPAGLPEAIAAAYADLGADAARPDPAVAVRSSAAGEDASDASYAGEHDSYLWVSGADRVVQRVRDCWASAWTARAISYRTHGHLPVTPVAVVVQHMVQARAAGVLMTLNPGNGDRSKVTIEAVWGLGEPLVSGAVDPDRWVLDKITGDVVSRHVAHKPTQMVRDPDGDGCTTVPVDESMADQPCLSSAQVEELVRMGRQLERRAGRPQDAEFAIADPHAPNADPDAPDAVRLLQARPETVWSTRERQPISDGQGALGAIVKTLSRGSGWTT